MQIVGKSGIEPIRVNLNLVYDYPVKWSKYKVLRDLVQNFYDAVGYKEWDRRFSYDLRNGKLTLKAKDTDFSYDWLIPIGASTKRDEANKYAGYFGEGFKIASLCAIRDFGWNIEMVSRDWELKVITGELEIDGRSLTSLAYNIWRLETRRKHTLLCLYLFTDESLLKCVLDSFYYPENTLFGKQIWKDSGASVHYRSNCPKPPYYPGTFDYGGPGIIFAGYQALGSFPYPLIFSLHGYRLDDRERSSFFRMDVIKVIERTVARMPPDACAEVLEALRSKWYDLPKKKYDFETWYPIIDTLVYGIAKCPRQTSVFRKKFPNLAVARLVKKSDIPRYNRRKQARAWLRNSDKKYSLVQDAFARLGYVTLEQLCEDDDGFTITRDPDALEKTRIELLEMLVRMLLSDFLEDDRLPPCKIIKSGRGAWSGMADCIPIKSPLSNSRGLKIRYRLTHVALKKRLLEKEAFAEALSCYLHELMHVFGSDGSAAFSGALTELLELMIKNSHMIDYFRKRWEVL